MSDRAPPYAKRDRRMIGAMLDRWVYDAERIKTAFGEFAGDDIGTVTEIQRNLETAIQYAYEFMAASVKP